MSDEESTTPDLVELVRRVVNVLWNRGDFAAAVSLLAPDIVYRPITTWTENQERRGIDQFRQFTEEFLESSWRYGRMTPIGISVPFAATAMP